MIDQRLYDLAGYDFELPDELIAHTRACGSEEKMLLIGEDGQVDDVLFDEWIDRLPDDVVLVFNDSKVVKARIPLSDVVCVDSNGQSHVVEQGEIFVYEIIDDTTAEVLVSDGKHFRPGWKVMLSDDVVLCSERFVQDGIQMQIEGTMTRWQVMEEYGQMPLPPYISGSDLAADQYQTSFAREKGSVAAPTASLRFTQDILQRLEERGVEYVFVTLHVGLGTFKPLYRDDIRDHELHREMVSVSLDTLQQLSEWKQAGKRLLAVGTTVCRVLESLPLMMSHLTDPALQQQLAGLCEGREDVSGWISDVVVEEERVRRATQLFVYPGYELAVIDGLVTNFHLPRTSLLVLVATILGSRDRLLSVYDHAIQQGYRFYSYGDGMVVWR